MKEEESRTSYQVKEIPVLGKVVIGPDGQKTMDIIKGIIGYFFWSTDGKHKFFCEVHPPINQKGKSENLVGFFGNNGDNLIHIPHIPGPVFLTKPERTALGSTLGDSQKQLWENLVKLSEKQAVFDFEKTRETVFGNHPSQELLAQDEGRVAFFG